MDNRATLGLFLAVGIIFGSASTGHAGCKSRREDLMAKRQSLNDDLKSKRLELQEKRENDQLTKEYLIATLTGTRDSIKNLKTDFEVFCQECPRAQDKCTDIISRLKNRIDRLQVRIDEYQGESEIEFEESFSIANIIPLMSPFEYSGAF